MIALIHESDPSLTYLTYFSCIIFEPSFVINTYKQENVKIKGAKSFTA